MNPHAGQLPPLRPGRSSKPETRPLTQATPSQARSSRGLWLLGALAIALVIGSVALAVDSRDTQAPASPAVDDRPADPPTVPALSVATETATSDLLLPGKRITASEDDSGCHLLAGRKAELSHYHVVHTDRGEILTAAAPLVCVDGTDYHLTVLLDCAPKRPCALISLFSTRTRAYYVLPPDSVSLIHDAGQGAEHFPTHLVLRKPARLRPYKGMVL